MILSIKELTQFPSNPNLLDVVFLLQPDLGKEPFRAYIWGHEILNEQIGEGNGFSFTFSGILLDPPVIENTVKVVAGNVIGIDDGIGNIVGDGIVSGTINYTTGEISLTFAVPPSFGTKIYVNYSSKNINWRDMFIETPVRDVFRTDKVLTKVKYTGRDFTLIYNELLGYLAQNFGNEFNDFVASSLGIMLVELLAYAADMLAWYQDQRATEMYIVLARIKDNIINLARNVGYKSRGAISSSVDLKITMNASYGFDVVFPKGYQFRTKEGIVFELIGNYVVPAGSPSNYSFIASAKQTETKTEIFYSNGQPNQVIKLIIPDGKAIVNDSVIVYVNGVLWTQVKFLEFVASNIYEVEYNLSRPEIRFGDGVAGNIPVLGAEIRVTYSLTQGLKGNVSANTITDVVEPLVINNNIIDFVVTNPSVSSGGMDSEDIESIRRNAPLIFAAQDRAVTQKDFEVLANAFVSPEFGAVAKAKVVLVRDISQDITLVNYLNQISEPLRTTLYNYLNNILHTEGRANHVIVYVLAKDAEGNYSAPSLGLLEALKLYLDERREVAVTVECVNAFSQVYPADILVKVNIDTINFIKDNVKTNILNELDKLLKDRDFGVSLYLSDVYEVVTKVDGVKFAHVTISSPNDPSKITIDGDMIISDIEVIRKGIINIIEI